MECMIRMLVHHRERLIFIGMRTNESLGAKLFRGGGDESKL